MIRVYANKQLSGELHYVEEQYKFVFNYLSNNPISITMPFSHESYVSRIHLHPVFDMNIPEGYLFEVLVNLLRKRLSRVDDFTIFSSLAPNISGWLTYETSESSLPKETLHTFTLEDVIENEDPDLFSRLVKAFLHRSAVSGMQPKVLAELTDKARIASCDYIVKAFGPEFPCLAENEYFCMKALQYAGIPTPRFWISRDKRLFVTERFDYAGDTFKAFEEFCVLFGKNRNTKYHGSYEQIAKAVHKISSRPEIDLETYFRLVVMNYLLKNGDAHLKNFGITHENFTNFRLAPAYDVVCTAVYLRSDIPALTMYGKKVWVSKKKLVRFGVKYCLINEHRAYELFEECETAVLKTINEITDYVKDNPGFSSVGRTMLNIFHFSLCRNLKEDFKVLPREAFDGLLENRPQNKRDTKKERYYPTRAR
ncbi:MAG: type II toxin-antitoxin system HipA family toxin [Deltaproteobacteria bacterium]|nr:type II toxin-antitoxin system HipA family toxin [Deltaproteobacteria bacterium]